MRKQDSCSPLANPLNDCSNLITKVRNALLLCLCSIAFLLAASIAFADGKGGGHDGGHGHYRGHGYYGGGLVFSFGGPYWGASWGYPYYPYYFPYYYPYYPAYYPYYYGSGVTIETSPPVYIERSRKTESPDMPALWFYCPDSKRYYPYVKECPGGWQSVPAQPPAQER